MATQIQASQLAGAERKPNLFHWANLLYLLIFVLSLLIAVRPAGSPGSDRLLQLDPALLMIIAQVCGVLLPALSFIWLTRQPVLTTLKLRRLRFGTSMKCFLIGLLCWPIIIVQGNLSAIITVLAGPQAGAATDTHTFSGSPWLTILAVVLVAPLFEELLFRGVFLDAYERRTGPYAFWLVAILFASYHFTLENLVLPLVIGLIAGWLAYRTRSIWAGVLVHVGANLLAGLLILMSTLAGPAGAVAASQDASVITLDVLWRGVMIWTGVGLVLFVPVCFLLRSIGKQSPAPDGPKIKLSFNSLWSYALVLIVVIVYFAAQLLS